MNKLTTYPGFEYTANELSKFIKACDFVTIQLKNGQIIHYTPDNIDDFIRWLKINNIKNIGDNGSNI